LFCPPGEPIGTEVLSSICLLFSYIILNLGKPIALLATCFYAGFVLGLFFDPENGGDMFLLNVGRLSADYTAL
jgi:hypothetical protein